MPLIFAYFTWLISTSAGVYFMDSSHSRRHVPSRSSTTTYPFYSLLNELWDAILSVGLYIYIDLTSSFYIQVSALMPSAKLLGSTSQIAAVEVVCPTKTSSDCGASPLKTAPRALFLSRPAISLKIALTLVLLAVNVVHPKVAPHNMLCTV